MNSVPCQSAPAPHAVLSVVTAVPRPGVWLLRAHGEIDAHSIVVLERAAASATAGRELTGLVLDFTRVRFLSAAGLDLLSDLLLQGRREGFTVRVAASTRPVLRTFALVGVDDPALLHESVPAALDSLD
ncbi:anti-anti-sigma factor [Amycolatopsis bartoniae]|uniref:STAS domain-containing protein n=1 Tax=Amycolatopsis bartoniae TaxID=941986 RepID=A0A8H9IRF7_9PSEU|nr:STAS domain-containing protein [Amycolatopsis bartoniae]MBB2937106.1 anti-anti-sigma factor [Amycolatopsis bartoniae]TVT04763.1 STAS domain-containing protein [Amycolatopsis bartoniae]GHF52475.1 hypothetical protein GCM10017566_27290 [Amycolatopsis bartoniae]